MRKILKRVWILGLWLAVTGVATSAALVISLRWMDPPGSAVILAWELDSGRRADYRWQPIESISPHLQIAVIASEDQKFPHHYGFDFESLKKAIAERKDRPRGASTITQQVAKNLFLWNGRSYLRKVIEAWFTVLMEALLPKERILELYLNIAEFGEGVYGAQAASQRFFGRSATSLSPWQSALLATVLPSPKRMSAARPSPYVRSRAGDIRRMVSRLGGTAYIPWQ